MRFPRRRGRDAHDERGRAKSASRADALEFKVESFEYVLAGPQALLRLTGTGSEPRDGEPHVRVDAGGEVVEVPALPGAKQERAPGRVYRWQGGFAVDAHLVEGGAEYDLVWDTVEMPLPEPLERALAPAKPDRDEEAEQAEAERAEAERAEAGRKEAELQAESQRLAELLEAERAEAE